MKIRRSQRSPPPCPTVPGLNKFKEVHPDRYFDTAIAEQHAVCFAAGLAAEGMKPITAIYSTFLQRAYDIILHDVAIQNLPVIFCLDRAGLVGDDGPTHHGVFDIAYLRPYPKCDDARAQGWRGVRCDAAIHCPRPRYRSNAGPIAIRYPRGNAPSWTGHIFCPASGAPGILHASYRVRKGETILEGDDITLMAYGNMVAPAFEAAAHPGR